MYCSACGTTLAPGLSYCNRCGMSLKERTERKQTGAITAFLTAITLIGVIGLGIMLGGALTLSREAHLNEDLVGFFMLFTFLIVMVALGTTAPEESRIVPTIEPDSACPNTALGVTTRITSAAKMIAKIFFVCILSSSSLRG